MIKAKAATPDGYMYLIGLSDGNIERLRERKPIKFALRALGIEVDGDVVIVWGPTEEDIAMELGMPAKLTDTQEKEP